MILQYSHLGNNGRLGNQLFQIASTIGLALRCGYEPRFPVDWKYRDYFNIPDEYFGVTIARQYIGESCFEYDETIAERLKAMRYGAKVELSGYLQSYKYWEGYEDLIREYLTPKGCKPGSINAIAVHHRRGDYVGNPNYATIPFNYYLNAYFFDKPVHAFSDDESFLRLHYSEYQHGTDIEDFKAMCEHLIVVCSNSTFAWWAAYISENGSYMFEKYFAGDLAKRCSTKDFWPSGIYPVSKCMTAIGATFIIPVQFDHPDRLENCTAVCSFLNEHFDCEILIGEINGTYFQDIPNTTHVRFDMSHFHRTKVINDLTRMAANDVVFNWDADVFASPVAILKAYHLLREGADVVYPYNGTFYWCDRVELKNAKGDLGGWAGKQFKAVGASPTDRNSYGGAVGYNREAFFKAGGENENLVSYGHDDQERWMRFNKLELDVRRVGYPLYHINHHRGLNSSFSHVHGRSNMKYWQQISGMNKEQLLNHIKAWSWK